AFSRDPMRVRRFVRAAELLRRLTHPNFVRYHDLGEVGGRSYLIREYVRGQDAGRLLHHGGPLPVRQAVRLIVQVLEAVAHLHEHGLVLRELKLSSLLLCQEEHNERVKISGLRPEALSGMVRVGETLVPEAWLRSAEQDDPNGGLSAIPAYVAPERLLR